MSLVHHGKEMNMAQHDKRKRATGAGCATSCRARRTRIDMQRYKDRPRIKVLQGDMPAKADDVSVFIVVIGMPLTPVSVAGVERRAYRRAIVR